MQKIKLGQNMTLYLVIIISSLTCKQLFSQESVQKPSRQAAMEAFSSGNYEKAYNEFNILLKKYSRDPLYKYYSGVCLVKLNREPAYASVCLQDALNGSLDIKNIPDDALFYLGRSQQMSGKYAEAIRSFGLFESKAGKKNARSYNVDQFVQECNEGKGQLKMSDSGQLEITDELKSTGSKNQPPSKPAQQRQSLPAEYDKLLSEAMDFQVKADSLYALSAGYRKEYSSLPASQKPAAMSRISETESLAASYQLQADEKFAKAGIQTATRKDTVPKSADVTAVKQVPSDRMDAGPAKPQVKQDSALTGQKVTEVYSLFEVELNKDLIKNQKISIDPELPAGLIYRIQMGVFSKPLSPEFFKGISPASGFRVSGTPSVKYFVGQFRRMADANRSLLIVKQMGFRDSFVTAIMDGKQVSADRAALLENEWGSKPLMTIETGPSTLVFRVEVAKTPKPVNRETEEAYRKLAGTRGLDILLTPDGSTAYIIGKFITFESAAEYADLMVRNGYREARVAAYLGSREVPLETAKELFEKIK